MMVVVVVVCGWLLFEMLSEIMWIIHNNDDHDGGNTLQQTEEKWQDIESREYSYCAPTLFNYVYVCLAIFAEEICTLKLLIIDDPNYWPTQNVVQ